MRIYSNLLCISIAFIGYISTEDHDIEENDDIVITSDVMSYETNSITIREGKQLMISCVCKRNDVAHKSDISWKKLGGHIIDGESSPSVFTIILNEKHTHFKKASLHFGSIHSRDAGLYYCTARNVGGEEFEKVVKINVLPKLEWISPLTAIGGLIDEPVTVNCDINHKTEDNEPHIHITSDNGEPLNETIFKIAGKEATIEHLNKEHQGLTVSCISIEMFRENDEVEVPVIDRKDVYIDVYYMPEFDSTESIKYTVIDNNIRDVYLNCTTVDSNPPVKYFYFFRDDHQITDSEKHTITVNKINQDVSVAMLKIRNVEETDLGTYKCEASNGKTKSFHNIHLRDANPPSQPVVTLLAVNKQSMLWKIESNENEQNMPIKQVEISHLRLNQIEKTGVNDQDIDDAYWKSHAITVRNEINPDGIYNVAGLRNAQEYVWRFRQFSDAGFGDSVIIRAKTFDEAEVLASGSNSYQLSCHVLFVIVIYLIYY